MRALDPWLDSHKHLELFPTPTWRPLKVDHMRHLMRDAIRAAALPDECTLHGFRYTFATRAIEFGLDWQTIESIVGHRTAEMARKYTAKRRSARLAITTLGHPTDDGEITNERHSPVHYSDITQTPSRQAKPSSCACTIRAGE